MADTQVTRSLDSLKFAAYPAVKQVQIFSDTSVPTNRPLRVRDTLFGSTTSRPEAEVSSEPEK